MNSNIPNLGASGAIAGVLGGYLLMFPKQAVQVLVGNRMTAMSALIVIGMWFVLQLFSGVASIYQHSRYGRRGLHGAHRRLRGRLPAHLPVQGQFEAADRLVGNGG